MHRRDGLAPAIPSSSTGTQAAWQGLQVFSHCHHEFLTRNTSPVPARATGRLLLVVVALGVQSRHEWFWKALAVSLITLCRQDPLVPGDRRKAREKINLGTTSTLVAAPLLAFHTTVLA